MTPTSNREEAIGLLEAERDARRAQLEQDKADLDALDRAIHLLRGNTHKTLPETVAKEPLYMGLRPQGAVKRFLRLHAGQPFKPSTIANELRAAGYQPTVENPNTFVTVVRTGCIRLTQKGILTQTEIDGKVAFLSPPEFKTPSGDNA